MIFSQVTYTTNYSKGIFQAHYKKQFKRIFHFSDQRKQTIGSIKRDRMIRILVNWPVHRDKIVHKILMVHVYLKYTHFHAEIAYDIFTHKERFLKGLQSKTNKPRTEFDL